MEVKKWDPQIKKAVNTSGRMLPSEQKDDFFQECYLILLEKQAAIEEIEKQGEEEARKYVYRICYNRCVDLLRNNMKEDEVFTPHDSYTPRLVVESPKTNDLDTELGRISYFGVSNADLDAAISRLSLEEQHVIRETFFEEHSTRHIARQVGKSQLWPRYVKKRALVNLRKQLEKR